MRVLLINPFYPLTEMPSPPLGLAYVASAFELAGAAVKVLDLVVTPYSREQLQELLLEFKPDMVGATSVTMTFNGAMAVLQDVKALAPNVTTVMGGPHVSFHARETLTAYPELDLVVLGEGEATVVELVTQIRAGLDLSDVAGLAYRQGDEILLTETRPPGFDVKKLPFPARHLLPMGRYRALGMAVSMITSRGCPFQCIFCVGRKMSGSKVRYRDPVAVVNEMEYLKNLGFSQINIADDLFTAKKSHCFAVCDEIIKRNLEVKWTAFSRANTISRPLLAKLKQAGCCHLSFGFESANEEILKTVQKRINRQQMLDAAEMCRVEGIPAQASFIYGLPGETLDTLRETLEFGEKVSALGTSYGIHLLAPFPGTLVRENADQYGLKILHDDWSRYTANTAIVENSHVSAADMEKTPREMEEMVIEHIAAIQQRLASGTASDEEYNNLAKLERMDIFYNMMMHNLISTSINPSDPDSTTRPAVTVKSPVTEHYEQKTMQALISGTISHVHYGAAKVEDAVCFALHENMLAYTEKDHHGGLSWVEPVAEQVF